MDLKHKTEPYPECAI